MREGNAHTRDRCKRVRDAGYGVGHRVGAQAVPIGASLGSGADSTTGGEGANTTLQEVDARRGSMGLF